MLSYFSAIERTHKWPAIHVKRYLDKLFHGVSLSGRTVLDVGGGNGMASFFAASRGASRVTCLEPLIDGSRTVMQDQFDALHRLTELDVDLRRCTLDRYLEELPVADRLDVVVMNNVINHLDEEACARLHADAPARDRYLTVFRNLYHAMEPGGDLLVADCGRSNLFGSRGLRSPFAPTIDWRIHQQPDTWSSLLDEVGFTTTRLVWNAPRQLGAVGQVLLGNRLGAYLTTSHFILALRRNGERQVNEPSLDFRAPDA